MGDRISFPKADTDGSGYLARAATPAGAVVVLQEWWGLNDQIKATCDRFAVAGFTALAPDLYDGRVTQEADEANHMMTGLDWGGAVHQDVRGAVRFLKAETGRKTGVMGFCMGGALTVMAAVHIPECDAAVCYYGIPPTDVADPAQVRVPFQGHFATQDHWCTPEAVAGLTQAMAGLATPVDIHRYDGAQHGFFNETVPAYDRDAAELSWTRTLDFMRIQL